MFILDVVKEEFISPGNGLLFKVKDFDRASKNDELGHLRVPGKKLLESDGKRLALKLKPPEGSTHTKAGVLNLRCRSVTNYDRKFLEYAEGKSNGNGFLGIDKNIDIVMNPRGGSKKLIKGKLKMTGAYALRKKELVSRR